MEERKPLRRLSALVVINFNGKLRVPGEDSGVFAASEEDAGPLIAVGAAIDTTPLAPVQVTQAASPAPIPTTEPSAPGPAPASAPAETASPSAAADPAPAPAPAPAPVPAPAPAPVAGSTTTTADRKKRQGIL